MLLWEELNGRNPQEAGRQLLARLYRAETGEDLPLIQKTPQGKPYFDGFAYHFSVSHTPTHVFCVLCRENVGLDAERKDRKPDLRLAKRWLSEFEQEQFSRSANPVDCFLRFWVLKESYAKLTGRGWGNYLKQTHFSAQDERIQEIDGHYVAVLTEDEENDHAV